MHVPFTCHHLHKERMAHENCELALEGTYLKKQTNGKESANVGLVLHYCGSAVLRQKHKQK